MRTVRPPYLFALTVAIGLCGPVQAVAQIVRTADATVRGLRESDFPRVIPLADNVYAYEDLNGDLQGNLAFTTNSLIVVTTDGVVVVDGQGSVAKTRRMVERIRALTPQPIRYVIIGADHGDHVAGNSAFPGGVTFIAHPTSKAVIEQMAAARTPQTTAAPVPVPHCTTQEFRSKPPTARSTLASFRTWYRAANNMPDALRQVYQELDGTLP